MDDLDKYEYNENKFIKISHRFRGISSASFYATHLKIAVQEWVKYLNSMPGVGITNSGSSTGDLFAVKVNGIYTANNKKIARCIKLARRRGKFIQFGFFKVNVVLDKLEQSLLNRK